MTKQVKKELDINDKLEEEYKWEIKAQENQKMGSHQGEFTKSYEVAKANYNARIRNWKIELKDYLFHVTDSDKKTNRVYYDWSVANCECDFFIQSECGDCMHIEAVKILLHAEKIPLDQMKIRPIKFVDNEFEISQRGNNPTFVTPSVNPLQRYREQVAFPFYDPGDIDFDVLQDYGISLYPFQLFSIGEMLKGRKSVLCLKMGLGKSQSVNSNILTPDGWKRMGDLKIGDSVIGKDGKSTSITGIYPQGKRELYRVSFSDKTSTICDLEHLWAVITNADLMKKQYRVMTLREIQEHGLRDKNNNRRYRIPMVGAVEFSEKSFLIHPYLLGILIGNGSLGGTCATISSNINDVDIIEYIESILPDYLQIKTKTIKREKSQSLLSYITMKGRKGQRSLVSMLVQIGLQGKLSHEKFIPSEYLFGSVSQRESLLQGLLDSDGYIAKDGNLNFSTSSRRLAEDMVHLVQSFGGTSIINTKEKPSYIYRGERRIGRPSYNMSIRLPTSVVPFKSARKSSIYKPKSKYPPTRLIDRIEPIGNEEAQCIRVAAPDSLYVTDSFIVTHNTLCALACCRILKDKNKILVIAPNSLKYQWQNEINRFDLGTSLVLASGADIEQYKDQRFLILSYQMMNRHYEKLAGKYDIVIADEIQKISNSTTKTWETISKIECDFLFSLSGTPIQNSLSDLLSIIDVLNPMELNPKWRFYEEYCICSRAKLFGVKTHMAPKLRDKLDRYIINPEIDYDQFKMPAKEEESVVCGLTEQQRAIHDDNMEMARPLIAKSINYPLTFSERCILNGLLTKARMASVDARLIDTSSTKSFRFQRIENLIRDLVKEDHKVVLYSEWIRCLDFIKATLEEEGIKYAFFTGKMTAKARNKSLKAFIEKPDIKVFLSTDSGGVGIDGLQTVANHVIHVEKLWNPMKIEQRNGRLVRALQKKKTVKIFYFTSECEVERMIEAGSARKHDLVHTMLSHSREDH